MSLAEPQSAIRPPKLLGGGWEAIKRNALILMVAVGIAARAIRWLWREPLWYDQATLALNIAGKTARQLFGPLTYDQAAPPGFLQTLRAIHLTLGDSELALYLPALVASIVSLILFAGLARRLFPSSIAIVVTSALALSERIVSHSAEIKPYTLDICVAVFLLDLATRPWTARARLMIRAAVGAVAVWFSYTSIFMLVGTTAALAPAAVRERSGSWRSAAQLSAALALAVVSQLAVYFLAIRHQRSAQLLIDWQNSYAPWSQPLRIPLWLFDECIALLDYPLPVIAEICILPSVIWGGIWMWTHQTRERLAILAFPILAVLASAALHCYPFGGSRATLFLFPGILLLAGSGLHAWARSPAGIPRLASVVTSVALIGWCAGWIGWCAVYPRHRGDMRSVCEYLLPRIRAGDAVWILDGQAQFKWYWRDQPAAVYAGERNQTQIPWRRFWVVSVFTPGRHVPWTLEPSLNEARSVAQEKERFVAPKGGAAILFERVDALSPATPRSPE